MSFKLPGSGSIRIDETDVSLPVSLRSATDGAGVTGLTNSSVTLTYLRQGGTVTPIVASPLGAINSAHSDGGFIEASSGSMPGTYRLDVPDAAFAVGADWVVVEAHAPTTAGSKMAFSLTEDGVVRSGTAQGGAAGSITLDANASIATQAYRGMKVHVVGGTGALEQTRIIESYATGTKVASVGPKSWDSNPDSASIFIITNDYAGIMPDTYSDITVRVEPVAYSGLTVEVDNLVGSFSAATVRVDSATSPNVNVEFINNAQLTGDGSATSWGPV